MSTVESKMKAGGPGRDFLPLIKRGLVAKIPFNSIIYIRQQSRLTTLVTKDHVLEFGGKLNDIRALLDDRFYQCHRSYIINLEHVVVMESDRIHMSNGDNIFVSRTLHQRARKKFITYLTGSER